MIALFDKVMNRASGISLYGIAPPKRTTDPERLAQIVGQQKAHFRELMIDGLVVYDIQDESERSGQPRPFPFLPTVDPVIYADDQLSDFDLLKVVYRAVQALGYSEFTAWLGRVEARPKPSFSVFFGAASASTTTSRLSLAEAYRLARERAPKLVVGGIAIAERHARKLDEHARILFKTEQGCRFFVTQAVYDVPSMKSLLSDYGLRLQDEQRPPVPIVCTFARCGSPKTLDFMNWLGISISPLARKRSPSASGLDRRAAATFPWFRQRLLPPVQAHLPGPVARGVQLWRAWVLSLVPRKTNGSGNRKPGGPKLDRGPLRVAASVKSDALRRVAVEEHEQHLARQRRHYVGRVGEAKLSHEGGGLAVVIHRPWPVAFAVRNTAEAGMVRGHCRMNCRPGNWSAGDCKWFAKLIYRGACP